MAKHFYELTLEITECHPQSSTVYLGSPSRAQGSGQRPQHWRGGMSNHVERRASEIGEHAIAVFGKKEKNPRHRPLRMGFQPSAWMMGSHLRLTGLCTCTSLGLENSSTHPNPRPPLPGPALLALHGSAGTPPPPRKPALNPAPTAAEMGPPFDHSHM